MTIEVDMKAMLEAGAHFGHQTRRWNPKMKSFIYTQRDGVHIIDLQQTVSQVACAAKFVTDAVALGASVLLVGTKKQAQPVIVEEAKRAGQYYVSNRWLGGTLTNFRTIKASLERLKTLCEKKEKGELEKLTKREGLTIERQIAKLESALGGIRDMTRLPGVMFLVDPNHEDIAKREAIKLKIPVIAIIDTNGDPTGITYPIVANDDAIRSIQYFTHVIADACLDGARRREQTLREDGEKEKRTPKGSKSPVAEREAKVGGKGRAYTAKKPTEQEPALSPEEIAAFAHGKSETDEEDEKKDGVEGRQ